MKKFQNNQRGFSHLLIILALLVAGAIGFVAVKTLKSDQTVNRSVDTAVTEQASPLSTQDQVILEQAKKLKKVDFDLDGTINSQDSDDDGDGVDDDDDSDDDNDEIDDDDDSDDDNDGVEDSEDNED